MTADRDRLRAALADRYRIERELGQGGMATVYLAEDLKHHRKVAIKVLKPELAAVLGAERFLQEIETTAQLQHPHILPLFDSGRTGGPAEFLYYVMPYVEGETLRERLDRETQLAVEEAVQIATDVAEALQSAHEQGVIHRDIKPENVLLHKGRAVVADFGIALAVSAAAGGRMTETGLSLGTPHYMSPEQATAEKTITGRSDIYSLGAVLYEMLAGNPPHVGSSAQQIIMKIVTEDTQPVTALRRSVPSNVAAAVSKALEKLPADRFETPKAFAEALHNPAFARIGSGTASAGPSARRTVLTLALAVVALVSSGYAVWSGLHRAPPPPVTWYEVGMPEPLVQFMDIPILAISPDGSRIVYVGPSRTAGGRQLWVRERTSLHATPIDGTDGAVSPVVSPDGQAVAFVSGAPARLRSVPIGGGPATVILDSAARFNGFDWGDDGYLYVGLVGGIARVPATGGRLEMLPRSPAAASTARDAWPDVLPGSGAVVFAEQDETGREIIALDTKTGKSRAVARGMFARYSASGHLLVATADGTLMAGRFDAPALTVGPLIPVVEGLRVSANGYADLALSAGGRLVYITGPSPTDPVDEAVWVGRDGSVRPVDPDWKFSSVGNSGWAISPDGTLLAIKLNGESGQDIWIKDLRTRALRRLTFDPTDDYRPRWSPDGRAVTFISDRAGGGHSAVFERRADGTGTARLLLDLSQSILEAEWSPDGKWLLARTSSAAAVSSVAGAARDVWAKPMTGDTALVPILTSPADERAMAISPDGQWLAYVSDASGADEVYVRPFPDVAAGQWQISVGGGGAPLWAHSGRELFYVNPGLDVVAVDLSQGPGRIGERKVLFSLAGYRISTNYTWFDLSPDDQRFLMVRESRTNGRVIVVENFFEELRAKVAK